MCLAMAWPCEGPVDEGAEDEQVDGAVEQIDPVVRVRHHCVDMLLNIYVACLLNML